VPGLQPTAEGNSISFGNAQVEVRRNMKNVLGGEQTGEYWYSLAFKVTDLGSLTTNGDFIVAFGSAAQTNDYGGRLFLRKDPTGAPNAYNIGVSKDSSAEADIAWETGTNHLVGQTNFVVCRYHTGDNADDTLLWINPDPSTYGVAVGSEPPPTLTASSGLNLLALVGQIILHQTSAAIGPGGVVLDNLRVEGHWPHVTPIPLTMSITFTNGSDVYLSWGGYQNVFLQQATNLTPPIAWKNLNSDASVRNWTVSNAATTSAPGFFRLVAWYVE
jgi:hypothetical protein